MMKRLTPGEAAEELREQVATLTAVAGQFDDDPRRIKPTGHRF